MRLSKFGRGFLTSSLALSILLGGQALASADQLDQQEAPSTQADLLLPSEEIEQVTLKELPIYYSSDLGTFDNVDALMVKARDAMANFESKITFTYTGNIDAFGDDFFTARERMLVQPGNDYIYGTIKSTAYSWKSNGSGAGYSVTMSFEYRGTAEQEAYVAQRVTEIAAQLTKPGMTDFEKVLVVNDYIVTNTEYSTKSATTPHHAYALLYEGKGVCQAYALVAYLLLTEMGVETRYVTGEAGEPHAWNSVKIDGVWYHLDTTWNDTIFNGMDLAGGVSYKYFLVTTEQLKQDHSWVEADFPVATDSRYSAYHDLMMGDIQGEEIYYASRENNYNLYKMNYKTGNKELVLNRPVQYVAAHNEYIYFSDSINNKYLTVYNVITKQRETLVEKAVTRLHIKDGVLHYKVGSVSHQYELPLSPLEQAIRDVELKILSLSEMSTKAELDAAQDLYNALTDEQKAAIKNLNRLTQLQDIYPVNLAAANQFAQLVPNYSVSSTRVQLKEIVGKFDALTPGQQALVSNKDQVLTFKGLLAAQDAQIKEVEEAIKGLSIKSKTYLTDIANIRKAYDALTEELRSEVTNFGNFKTAEESVLTAQEAFNLIEALDGTSVAAIVAARKAYTATPKASQKYVTNIKKLSGFESQLKSVLAAVKAIDAIDPTSTKFVSQVTAARKAYDKAGTQQNLVTNGPEFLIIEEQAKVFNAIAKLKPTSAKYIAEVAAAKTAYDQLSVKELVTNAEKLTAAIEAIKPSEVVVAQIAALDGKTVAPVMATRASYNELSKAARKYVTNVKQLTALEKSLKNEITAIKEIDLIDPTNPKFISQVKKAKKAYDKKGVKKELVTNADKLNIIAPQVEVFERINKMKLTNAKLIAEVTAIKEAYDKLAEKTHVTNVDKLTEGIEAIQAAQTVIGQISAITGTSAQEILTVREAYDKLDKQSKKYVTNVKVLTAAEKNMKDVLNAMKAINAIDPASTKFLAQVKAAKKAYDKAGAKQSLVTNVSTYETIAPQATVFEQINKLKPTSAKYIAEVTAAKTAYDALTTNTLVTNATKLTEAVEAIKPAQAVVTQIDALTGNSIASVVEARAAFNALDKTTKKYVTNQKALKSFESKMKAPIKAVNLIDEVKKIEASTSNFMKKAAAMKKAYTALSDENKALVTNVEDYKKLVALYEIKNAQAKKKWDAVTASTFADLDIEGVTADNLSKVITGFNDLAKGTGTSTVAEISGNVAKFIGV